MAKVIAIQSYRRGTGKSNLAANIAALLAAEGRRVGAVDTSIQSPSLHLLFGLGDDQTTYTLSDYLRGKCDVQQTAHDVTARLGVGVKGQIYLVPASTRMSQVARTRGEDYAVDWLDAGFHELIEVLDLDALVVDTPAGLDEETLLSIAVSDVLVVVVRPDQQDYQGTSVTVEVARKLDVPHVMLIVNQVPAVFDVNKVKAQVERAYGCTVAAVLPYSNEMMALASGAIFTLHYPDHSMTVRLKGAVAKLMP